MAMDKRSILAQLRASMEATKRFTAGLFGSAAGAIAEMEETKADKGAAISVTIQANSWVEPKEQDGSTVADTYPYFYRLTAEHVTALDRVTVIVSKESLSEAASCGLCPTCETANGEIRLWSADKPNADISAEYWIGQGKE